MAKKAEADSVPVFPASEAILPGVSHRPTIADEATAARLVASRAFTYDAPEGDEPTQFLEFDEAERPALDQWVSPVNHGDHYKK